jgi:hypothetical protein
MNNWGWVDPRVDQVRVANAQSYMLRNGWKRRPYPRPELLVFEGPLDDDGNEIIQVIPSSERAGDYRLRVVQLIDALSVFEDRSCVAILNDLLAEHAALAPVNGQNGASAPVSRRDETTQSNLTKP